MSTPPAFAEAANCKSCNATFGMLKRRHHCRQCGQSFCDEHSNKNMPLPHFNLLEPCRVCEKCHGEITNPKKTATAAAVSGAAPSEPKEEPPAPAPAPPAVVETAPEPAAPAFNCTCGMPLCICEKPVPEKKKVEKSPAASPKASPRKSPAPKTSDPAPAQRAPSFMNLSGSSSATANTYENSGDGLRSACKAGDLAGVKGLLEANTSLATFRDRQGQSVLHVAAMFGFTEICKELMKHGADPNVKNSQGESVLDVAPVSLANALQNMKL
eukprot:GFYU01000721.1.p1 GENE.GFYU01000721.1~~GFYU01000721.1.p1  ORF type:complete len:270 (-),score=50.90 GFYU01000721.1:491-1300(-)